MVRPCFPVEFFLTRWPAQADAHSGRILAFSFTQARSKMDSKTYIYIKTVSFNIYVNIYLSVEIWDIYFIEIQYVIFINI
jgi:hypothetical protein